MFLCIYKEPYFGDILLFRPKIHYWYLLYQYCATQLIGKGLDSTSTYYILQMLECKDGICTSCAP